MQKSLSLFMLGALAVGGSASLYAQGDAAKGKDVFDQNCAVCHNADSTDRKMGPGLKGLFKKAKLDSTGKPVNDANVMEQINNGGNGMPAYKDNLSADEKTNLLAYLKTL